MLARHYLMTHVRGGQDPRVQTQADFSNIFWDKYYS